MDHETVEPTIASFGPTPCEGSLAKMRVRRDDNAIYLLEIHARLCCRTPRAKCPSGEHRHHAWHAIATGDKAYGDKAYIGWVLDGIREGTSP